MFLFLSHVVVCAQTKSIASQPISFAVNRTASIIDRAIMNMEVEGMKILNEEANLVNNKKITISYVSSNKSLNIDLSKNQNNYTREKLKVLGNYQSENYLKDASIAHKKGIESTLLITITE